MDYLRNRKIKNLNGDGRNLHDGDQLQIEQLYQRRNRSLDISPRDTSFLESPPPLNLAPQRQRQLDLGNGMMTEGISNTILAVQREEAALNKRCMDPGKTGYLFKLARGDHGTERFEEDPRYITSTALTTRSRGDSVKRMEEQREVERA